MVYTVANFASYIAGLGHFTANLRCYISNSAGQAKICSLELCSPLRIGFANNDERGVAENPL